MKRRVVVGGMVVVGVVACLGAVSAPIVTADIASAASPGGSSGLDSESERERPAVVDLDHPVPLEAALRIVADAPVAELRVSGKGFGGVLLLSPTDVEDIRESLRSVGRFQTSAGVRPAVTRFTTVGASPSELGDLTRRLNALPAVALGRVDPQFGPGNGLTTTLKERQEARTSLLRRNGQSDSSARRSGDVGVVIPTEDYTLDVFENAYPSAAFSEMIDVTLASTSPYNLSIGFVWEYVPTLGVLHHTQLWPDDWGLEIGPTLYNEELSGLSRPLCLGGGDSDTDFFFETWDSASDDVGFFVTWNIPEEAEPYVDSEITFDSCKANSLEIGVGKPRELVNNSYYYAMAWMTVGTQSDSLVGAVMSAKTNDCNNLGQPASSFCMGLNTNAEPDYIVPFETLLNRDRELTAPLVFKMADYYDQPMIIDPAICPSLWCS